MSTVRIPSPVIAALVLLLGGSSARAAVFLDHLTCWQVKDPAAKASYSADLFPGTAPFPANTGCQVKVPAKLLCVSTAKQNVTPPPPGAPTGIGLSTELLACYKVKCPKAKLNVAVTDKFGSRTMTTKVPSILCAPANVRPPCGSATAPACDGTCDVPEAHCAPIGGTCVCGLG